MRSKTCVLSSWGRAVHTQAVAAETIGAEKLVPSTDCQPFGSYDSGNAATMC